MRHIIFEESPEYTIALLIKPASFGKQELINNYILDLENQGVPRNKIIAFTLDYSSKKPSAKDQKEYLSNLLPALKSLGVTYLYCCDGNYFKTLIKDTKADVHLGYSIPCGIKGFEDMQVVLGVNHHAVVYNPESEHRLLLGNKTMAAVYNDSYKPLGQGIIHKAEYPQTNEEKLEALKRLMTLPVISCDIETFSLKFQHAGIGTIAFGTSQHEGIAFTVDYIPHKNNELIGGVYGYPEVNRTVRFYLKEFFKSYTGKIIWHGATFDIRVLIYQLFMLHPLDREGMLEGLHTMTKHFDDTKTISYLAVNSTAGNDLGLKDQAHEFAGNWAKGDIENILTIPVAELLQYNLVDVLSTHYVYNKNWPIAVRDSQEEFYYKIGLPSLKTIIACELVGMPLLYQQVEHVNKVLEDKKNELLEVFKGNHYIDAVNLHIQTKKMNAANAKLKTKQHPLSKYAHEVFNPDSNQQVQYLLYDLFKLPVIDFTDTKQPATGTDTLKKLINHTNDPEKIKIIETLISFSQVAKILSSFMPAFLEAFKKGDGIAYLHGCFNFGGTVSGRLSSSDPNLQNLPANSFFAKLIKSCFQAAKGWLMVGADFASLEDRINALLTKDPNKLKVYTDGYDGHSLRAYAYFKEQMQDIRQATDTDRCFEVRIDGQTLLAKSGDFIINSKGEKIPVETFYDTNCRF